MKSFFAMKRALFLLMMLAFLLLPACEARVGNDAIVARRIDAQNVAFISWEDLELPLSTGSRALIPLAWLQQKDEIILGGSFVLSEGERLNGNLLVLGGVATLEAGSTVHGNILLMGGSLQVSGVVNGEILALGGVVDLTDTAQVTGAVHVLGSNLQKAAGAVVLGGVNQGQGDDFPWNFSGTTRFPLVDMGLSLYTKVLWFLARSLLWSVLAMLVALFFPRQTQVAGRTASEQPWIATGMGLLTVFIAPFLLLLLSLTIIGIPVALLALFIGLIAWGFGVVSLGTETGTRLAHALKTSWSLPLAAGIGTFLLTALLNGIGAVIPCVGWLLPFTVGGIGFGAVLLSYFGNRAFTTSSPRETLNGEADQPYEVEPEAEAASKDETSPNEA